jgi:hypothetical protein
MQDPDFISIFVAPLEKAGLRYMVTGSVASSIYGEPRNTLDIDLVLLLEKSQGEILTRLFPEEDFYIPPVEVIEIEARREARGHFNIIHHETGFKADIYLSRNHPYLDWAFAHTRRIESPACQANIAPPEYVILHKLEFYKESNHQRHLRDIAGILEQQELDRDFLATALDRLNLNPEYQLALSLTDYPS